jgi:membrane protease YdiL (CAAX protease family)
LFSQLVCILLPTLVMAFTSVRSFAKTFLFERRVPWKQVLVALLLAVCLNPVGTTLVEGLARFFPLPPGITQLAEQMDADGGWSLPIGVVLLLMAVLPAVCEELAFRGFVLSGLRSRVSPVWAVVLSAIFFGLAHSSALQQTVSATLLGLVLGYIAVKTSQITPCIAFHMGYNGLQLMRTSFAETLADARLTDVVKALPDGPVADFLLKSLPHEPLAEWFFRPSDSPAVVLGYSWPVVTLSGLAAVALLWQVGSQRCRKAGTIGLQGGTRSPLPQTAPTEESGA